MAKLIHKLLPFSLLTALYLALLAATLIVTFEKVYENKALPRVFVSGINVSGMTEGEIEKFFAAKRALTKSKHFIFRFEGKEWVTNTDDLEFKFDAKKMAHDAISVGKNFDVVNRISAFWHKTEIPAHYVLNEKEVDKFIAKIKSDVDIEPVDALFNFDGARVSAFQFSKNGLTVDAAKIKQDIWEGISKEGVVSRFQIQAVAVLPKVDDENANKLGIKELLGTGISYFYDSIPSRIYNIKLASSKFNGVLIKPGETFSFLKTVGSISKLDGYKEAYVIKDGKTVLGDGGGVCQVSTTLYRAALYAGLPIVERTAHSYRVGYYEPPVGFDATIYQPGGPDLKFKNNTSASILIQTYVDEENLSLTFSLYGTSDGRAVQISDPVVVSTTPPPETKYQDDPTLPKGVEKQIDTAHPGAKVYFTRRVLRENEVLLNEKIWSNYIPWAAVIARGTK